jgi:hypothetical protein
LLTVIVAVNEVPSALAFKFDAATLESIAPLASMNLTLVAPLRFAPLIVKLTVVFRDKLTGETLEMFGPFVTETGSLCR